MSFLFVVYNYPILSLDNIIVNTYIKLGLVNSPFGSMAMLRTTLRCIALEPRSIGTGATVIGGRSLLKPRVSHIPMDLGSSYKLTSMDGFADVSLNIWRRLKCPDWE
jgi:hypothetical protein